MRAPCRGNNRDAVGCFGRAVPIPGCPGCRRGFSDRDGVGTELMEPQHCSACRREPPVPGGKRVVVSRPARPWNGSPDPCPSSRFADSSQCNVRAPPAARRPVCPAARYIYRCGGSRVRCSFTGRTCGQRAAMTRLVAIMAVHLGLNLVGLHGLAALLPFFIAEWSLSASQAGWLSGIPVPALDPRDPGRHRHRPVRRAHPGDRRLARQRDRVSRLCPVRGRLLVGPGVPRHPGDRLRVDLHARREGDFRPGREGRGTRCRRVLHIELPDRRELLLRLR